MRRLLGFVGLTLVRYACQRWLEVDGHPNSAGDRRPIAGRRVECPSLDGVYGLGVEISSCGMLDDDIRDLAPRSHGDPKDHGRVKTLILAPDRIGWRRSVQQMRRMQSPRLRVSIRVSCTSSISVRARIGGRVHASVRIRVGGRVCARLAVRASVRIRVGGRVHARLAVRSDSRILLRAHGGIDHQAEAHDQPCAQAFR
jgi:hypothetical protein